MCLCSKYKPNPITGWINQDLVLKLRGVNGFYSFMLFFKYPHLVVSTEMGKRKYKKKGGWEKGAGGEEEMEKPCLSRFFVQLNQRKIEKHKKKRWKANIFAAWFSKLRAMDKTILLAVKCLSELESYGNIKMFLCIYFWCLWCLFFPLSFLWEFISEVIDFLVNHILSL